MTVPLVLLTVVTGGERGNTPAPLVTAALIPDITESPRKRNPTKRGRKRRFDAAFYALRMRIERSLAREDTCQRLWLRFERLQQRYAGMKSLA